MNDLIRFILRISLIFFIALPTQALIQNALGYDYFEHHLLHCYLANYIMVIVIFSVLFFAKEKLASSLGFLFLGGFFLKLIVFFILFEPIFKSDGNIQRGEFLAFFTPYAIALTMETQGMVKILNRS